MALILLLLPLPSLSHPTCTAHVALGKQAYQLYKSNLLDLETDKQDHARWDTVANYDDQGYTPHPQPRAAYAAMITQLDLYVGQIREKIKMLGAIRYDGNAGKSCRRKGSNERWHFNAACIAGPGQ